MGKSADAFRTISEVADWLGVQAHVLRFWESKFAQIKPVKRAGGRRYYRPKDMRLIGGIKHLLHDEGLTIKGVQKLLRDEGLDHVSSFSKELEDVADDTPAAPAPKMKTVKPAAQSKPTPDKPAEKAAPVPTEETEAPFIEATEEQPDADVVPFAAAKTAPSAPEAVPAATEAVDTAAAAPKTTKIPTVDVPVLDDSDPEPGILTHAYACKALSQPDVIAIQPMIERLQALRDQMASQRR